MYKIAVIGGGWYGCHLALALKRAGYDVVLYEKNAQIFGQISGKFGIRLHRGPHYPRSEETRKNCLRGYEEFRKYYPELVVDHEYSLYALGEKDVDGLSPKVGPEVFKKVCEESDTFVHLDPKAEDYPYQNLLTATHIEEPSIALGDRLRQAFIQYLKNAGVEVRYNSEVQEIKPGDNEELIVKTKDSTETYNKVINSTSYQALVPEHSDFPFDMEVVYQTCLALEYRDKTPGEKPFSFIVMDGWFPCVMPVCDERPGRRYILTHGKWTIMGSYPTPMEANKILDQIDDKWINATVKPMAEEDINRFWPAFAKRFEYIGWRGTVLAKIKTRKEFRSAVTYEKEGMIQIIPGKVQNIFDVEREVMALLMKENLREAKGYLYVRDGVLDLACAEIVEKPTTAEPNTGNLRTFEELNKKAESALLKPVESESLYPVLGDEPVPPGLFFPTPSDTKCVPKPPSCPDLLQVNQEPEKIKDTNSNNYFILRCLATMAVTVTLLTLFLLTLYSVAIVTTVVMIGVGYCAYRLFSEKKGTREFIEHQPGEGNRMDHLC